MRTQLSAILDGTADFRNTFTLDDMSRATQIDQHDVSGGNIVADKRIDLTYNDYGNIERIARYASLDTSEHVASTFAEAAMSAYRSGVRLTQRSVRGAPLRLPRLERDQALARTPSA